MMGFAVVVGAFGLAGVYPRESRAEAAPAALPAALVEVGPLDLPVPPPLVSPETVETTTTTTLAVEATTTTTTTVAPPAETTTTTTAPAPAPSPKPASPKPVPPKPRAALGVPATQGEVEAIADSTGWNWRAAGVSFRIGYHPTECCHWGVYEAATSIIWVGPSAFGERDRLRYVVLHELAHGWQYRQNRFREIIADYSRYGFGTIGPALEAGADCLAGVWGARAGHYWKCPADARALAARRLGGDWS